MLSGHATTASLISSTLHGRAQSGEHRGKHTGSKIHCFFTPFGGISLRPLGKLPTLSHRLFIHFKQPNNKNPNVRLCPLLLQHFQKICVNNSSFFIFLGSLGTYFLFNAHPCMRNAKHISSPECSLHNLLATTNMPTNSPMWSALCCTFFAFALADGTFRDSHPISISGMGTGNLG